MAPAATAFAANIPYRTYELGQRITPKPMQLISAKDPRLFQKSKAVETPAEMEYALNLRRSMIDTMASHGGIGLAAPQIGINLRFFVAPLQGCYYICINPEIIEHGKTQLGVEEGCLSKPGFIKTVERWRVITVRFFAQDGPKTLVLKGTDARCFQHELDHLDGICIFPQPKEPKDLKLEAEEEAVMEE